MEGWASSFAPGSGLAVVLLVAPVMTGCAGARARASAAILETPGWRQPGTLQLRLEGGGFLMRHNLPPVYRWLPGAPALAQADPAEWEAAGGTVYDCEKPLIPPPETAEIDAKTMTLRGPEGTVDTAGRGVLAIRLSPNRTLLAVLSADGRRAGSILPFVGGGSYTGTHYHNTLSYPDLNSVSAAVRLPRQRETDILVPCWLADRYVVYSDSLSFYAVVVPVADLDKQKSSEVHP
ncbi:MAG: hypothetical protein IT161_16300 [Bryobacterales bacterium]|nr:hypothetical protein [Bryobacterales bacterium]